VANPVKGLHSPTIPSFEETLKTSYSHGLESIYKLENVDFSTVKPLHSINQPEIQTNIAKKADILLTEQSHQLELDLGTKYRTWIKAPLPQEPIQVLGLSRHAEKCLLDLGINQLERLLNGELQNISSLKTVGQGHLDEIAKQLKEYVGSQPQEKAYGIDWGSWLRALMSQCDRRKVELLLHKFELFDQLRLNSQEGMEIKRLPPEHQKIWKKDALAECCQLECRKKAIASLEEIADVFIKPWMLDREGIVKEKELIERLEQVSYQPELVKPILHFLREVYFEDLFAFRRFLVEVEPEVYCINKYIAHQYSEIVDCISSYFYKNSATYLVPELHNFVTKELLPHWKDMSLEFFMKAIRFSSLFRIRKDRQANLFVLLA